MASSRKKIDLQPELYDYYACFTRPRIVEYYDMNDNYDLAENLSSLRYVTAKPGVINLDIKMKEKKPEENSCKKKLKFKQSDTFFRFIANQKEIIQRYTETKIDDVGFVFGRTTLSKIANALYDKYDTFILCAHILRGVIYVHHDLEKDFPGIGFDPTIFYEYCNSSKIADSKSKIRKPKQKFVIVSETNLKQHRVLNRSELYGLDANDEQFQKEIPLYVERKLVIDELNKRDKVELGFSTNYFPNLTINKTRRLWAKCFWCGSNKTLCGFVNRNAIVTEIKSYFTSDLEDMGKGKWKEREILNFTTELLTFIKDCFKEKLKSEDIKTANQRLYFQKFKCGDIELTEKEDFNDMNWIPDWYINNESIPQTIH